mmetsp:Transcript_7974/g.17376  ORF Transcript_7974/g.17376 Transcript_7974/m.17376 type:complete len:240 (-) Transcript_7974:600-1319(-)
MFLSTGARGVASNCESDDFGRWSRKIWYILEYINMHLHHLSHIHIRSWGLDTHGALVELCVHEYIAIVAKKTVAASALRPATIEGHLACCTGSQLSIRHRLIVSHWKMVAKSVHQGKPLHQRQGTHRASRRDLASHRFTPRAHKHAGRGQYQFLVASANPIFCDGAVLLRESNLKQCRVVRFVERGRRCMLSQQRDEVLGTQRHGVSASSRAAQLLEDVHFWRQRHHTELNLGFQQHRH